MNAFTSAPADTNILSATEPGAPSEGGRGKEEERGRERGREGKGEGEGGRETVIETETRVSCD